MNRAPAPIDPLTDVTLAAMRRGEPLAPATLVFLLRQYAATTRGDLGEELGKVLATAVDEGVAGPGTGQGTGDVDDPEWLHVFAEASSLSSDERLPKRAIQLATALRAEWPSQGRTARAMRGIEACLVAAMVLPTAGAAPDLTRAAIDELERIVGLTYEPGDGLAAVIGGRETAGQLDDQAAAASALLTAYAATGRLAYSMLAQELMDTAHRRWWDEGAGVFRPHPGREEDPAARSDPDAQLLNCRTARVLHRLATLHADEDYRQQVVPGRVVDYAGTARRILSSLDLAYQEHPLAAVEHGLAVGELSGQL